MRLFLVFKNNKIRKVFLSVFFGGLIAGCAVQGPPSGGPVDRTPPEVVGTDPLPATVHIPVNTDQITLTFSERMKEGTERNNLFISPPVPIETEWKKGRILRIHLKERLEPEQTYVLSVGSGLQDLRNNKMSGSFLLAFSTGDTIDQGSIAGRVYGLKPNETFYIFAYLLRDSARFNPFKQKPNYVSQTGRDGDYKLNYLKTGLYRILTVEDRNHNLHLDAAMERFGISYQDVRLTDSLSSFNGLDFRLSVFDTIPPALTGVRALYKDLVRVRFSEPIVPDSASKPLIADSLSGEKLFIKAFGKNPESKNRMDVITETLDSARTYVIRFSQLKDSSGNKTRDALEAYFSGTGKTDTTHFKLITHSPKDSAKNVRPEIHIKIKFNLPTNWNDVQKHYSLTEVSGDTVEGFWKINTLYDAEFIPSEYLKPDASYISSLNLKEIKNYREKSAEDTLSRHYFTIISQKELGEVSGTIDVRRKTGHPIVLHLRPLSGKRFGLTTVVKKRRTFRFEYVPEGEYLLDGFIDLNENSEYDAGSVLPFRFAEPFRFMTDTIKVRKRWETAGTLIELPVGQ
ncbi:MAG: Ig-like domain-containing protein [Calditrichaeota bacterium]|nr:Ig-like domain-containing protein [Calditrichota bacterium]